MSGRVGDAVDVGEVVEEASRSLWNVEPAQEPGL